MTTGAYWAFTSVVVLLVRNLSQNAIYHIIAHKSDISGKYGRFRLWLEKLMDAHGQGDSRIHAAGAPAPDYSPASVIDLGSAVIHGRNQLRLATMNNPLVHNSLEQV
jgi:hypothetical protein